MKKLFIYVLVKLIGFCMAGGLAYGDETLKIIRSGQIKSNRTPRTVKEHKAFLGCCGHDDCTETEQKIRRIHIKDTGTSLIFIDHYPPFILPDTQIHEIEGSEHVCRKIVKNPPDSKNTKCVFIRNNPPGA